MADEVWEQPKAKGWRAKSKDSARTTPTNAKTPASDKRQTARPTRIVDGLTVEKLVDELQKMEKRWNGTECGASVVRFLRKRSWNVENAVCIGIGSFSIDWEHRYRSLWQLVLFLDFVRSLSKRPTEIQLYAQEPAFNSLDEAFLKSLSIDVLPSKIENFISRDTFVFAPFVDWYILLPLFLKDKDPELYIGNEILDDYTQYAETAEKQMALAECKRVGKAFALGRSRVRLPDFELHANALNGLMVYWKEEEDEED